MTHDNPPNLKQLLAENAKLKQALINLLPYAIESRDGDGARYVEKCMGSIEYALSQIGVEYAPYDCNVDNVHMALVAAEDKFVECLPSERLALHLVPRLIRDVLRDVPSDTSYVKMAFPTATALTLDEMRQFPNVSTIPNNAGTVWSLIHACPVDTARVIWQLRYEVGAILKKYDLYGKGYYLYIDHDWKKTTISKDIPAGITTSINRTGQLHKLRYNPEMRVQISDDAVPKTIAESMSINGCEILQKLWGTLQDVPMMSVAGGRSDTLSLMPYKSNKYHLAMACLAADELAPYLERISALSESLSDLFFSGFNTADYLRQRSTPELLVAINCALKNHERQIMQRYDIPSFKNCLWYIWGLDRYDTTFSAEPLHRVGLANLTEHISELRCTRM